MSQPNNILGLENEPILDEVKRCIMNPLLKLYGVIGLENEPILDEVR